MENMKFSKVHIVREIFGGESYEYYPLGNYIVASPGICGGRPTFKYTRLEVSVILSLLAAGETIDEVVKEYANSSLSPEAVQEAIHLAGQALVWSAETIMPAQV